MNTSMLVIIGIYIAICLGIGAYSSKLQTNAGEFYTSGNRLGPWVSGLAVSSTIMSGYGWVGSIGSMYKTGYVIFWLTIPAAWGVLFSYLALGKPLRSISERFGALTLPQIVEVRYNSETVHLLTTIAIIIGLVGYNMTNLKALGSLGEVIFGMDYMFALTVGTILIGIYIFLGGMLSAALTAAFQSFIMCVAAIIAVIIAYKNAGGFTTANLTLAAINPSMVKMVHTTGTYNIVWVIGTILLYSFGVSGQPHVVNKFYQLKDAKMIKFSMIVGVVSYSLTGIAYMIGTACRAMTVNGTFPELLNNTDLVTATFISKELSVIFGGVMMASVLAAIMSTVSGMVLTASSAMHLDIHIKYFAKNKKYTDKQMVRQARIYSAVFLVISYLFVLKPPTVVTWIGYGAWGILVSTLFPVLVFGCRWRRGGELAAKLSIITGFIGSLGLLFAQQLLKFVLPIPPAIIGFVAAVIVYVVVALITPIESNPIFGEAKNL